MYNLDEKIKSIMIELAVNKLSNKKFIYGKERENNPQSAVLLDEKTGEQMDFWIDSIKNTEHGDCIYIYNEFDFYKQFDGLMREFFHGYDLNLYKNNNDGLIKLCLCVGMLELIVPQEEIMKYIDVVSLFEKCIALSKDKSLTISTGYLFSIYLSKKRFQIILESFFVIFS